jgi:hypothetical protein
MGIRLTASRTGEDGLLESSEIFFLADDDGAEAGRFWEEMALFFSALSARSVGESFCFCLFLLL